MSEAGLARADDEPLIIGRYALFDAIASGGMATVHLGRLLGPVGFGRTVAVKRLHSHFTTDLDFVTMFMDEARIVARIRHPNVVPMVDVIESSKGLFLVMEYVHGESFSKLLRASRALGERVPIKLVAAVLQGVLLGLHAAHETKGANHELLDVVHRDVSPQNIMVGTDGVARVLDFGVAKAAGRAQVTREGQIKGKLAYMSPEQIRGKVDRRADVFAASVMLWEALAGRRLHEGSKDVEIVTRVVQGTFMTPSQFRPDIPPELDAIVMRGLEVDPDKRYPNAREMAVALERAVGIAAQSEVGEWVERLAPNALAERAARVSSMEKASGALVPIDSAPPPALDDPFDPASQDPFGAGELTTKLPLPDAGFATGQGYGPNAPYSSSFELESRSGTPMATELPPAEAPRRDLAPVVALVSFCVALALVGILLGGWSLYAGARRVTPPAPTATVTANRPPRAVPSEPASTVTPTPPPSAQPKPATPRPKALGGAGAETPSATTTASTPPASSASAAAKKNCDPPYTIDESGHHRYKPDCMDN